MSSHLTHPRLVARHALVLAGLRRVAVVVELALLEVPQNLLAVDGVEKVFGRELLLKSEQIYIVIRSLFDVPFSNFKFKLERQPFSSNLGNFQNCHFKRGVTVSSHFYR